MEGLWRDWLGWPTAAAAAGTVVPDPAVTALLRLGGGLGGNYLTSWLYATVDRLGDDAGRGEQRLREGG